MTPDTNVAITAEEKTEAKEEVKEEDSTPKEMVKFKVVYNKQKYDINFPLDETVQSLKDHLTSVTGEN